MGSPISETRRDIVVTSDEVVHYFDDLLLVLVSEPESTQDGDDTCRATEVDEAEFLGGESLGTVGRTLEIHDSHAVVFAESLLEGEPVDACIVDQPAIGGVAVLSRLGSDGVWIDTGLDSFMAATMVWVLGNTSVLTRL